MLLFHVLHWYVRTLVPCRDARTRAHGIFDSRSLVRAQTHVGSVALITRAGGTRGGVGTVPRDYVRQRPDRLTLRVL